MSASQLLAELAGLGIRLEARGDRLRFAPRSALTPDLAERLKTHKAELLPMLSTKASVPPVNPANAATVWQAALDELSADPCFPPEMVEVLRLADVRWAGPSGNPAPAECRN